MVSDSEQRTSAWRLTVNHSFARTAFLRTILVAATCGFLAVLTFSMLMWSFVQIDNGELRSAVRQGFANGALVAKSGPLFDMRLGEYMFNDCLILQTLMLGRDNWRHSVIDSTIYFDAEPCKRLEDEALGRPPSASTYQYSRYVFAARVVSAPLIVVFGIDRAKQVVRTVTYLTLLVTALIAIHRLTEHAQAQSLPRTLYLASLLCVASILGLYRLEYYAQTLAHGYSELVLASFLLYWVMFAKSCKEYRTPTSSIVLGVLTGCFELLTGPTLIAVGIAVLMSHCAAPARSHPFKSAALASLGCIAGVFMTMFWQQALISALSDAKPFYQFVTHLAMRLQLHRFFAIPFEPQWATPENLTLYSPGDVVISIVNLLPTLTYGSPLAAALVFACSAIAIVLGPLLSRPKTRPGCIIAAAVTLALPIWYFAFANHTVLHSLYMVRMAVLLPMCAGTSLMFVFAPDSWLIAQYVHMDAAPRDS